MGYLFFQTLLWILLALLLGLVLGWLLRGVICGPCKDEDSNAVASGSASSPATEANFTAASAGATEVAAKNGGTGIKPAAKAPVTKAPTAKAPAAKKTTTKASPTATKVKDAVNSVTDNMKPQSLNGPNGGVADDLKRIRGVGPVIEKTLNGLGVYHFTQVGDFSEDNIKWVDNFISFPGRIKREEWVSQAQDLAKGAQTEFASRYDKGKVGEDNPNT